MKNTLSIRYVGHRKFVSGSQAAKMLGVTNTTFSAWRKSGRYINALNPQKFGAREFFPMSAVKEFSKTYKPHSRQTKEKPHYTPELDAVERAISILQSTLEELKSSRNHH